MICSCGRAEAESGNDLCAICHQEYDERQYYREQESAYNAEKQAEYEEWLNEQGPKETGDV